MMKHFVLHDKSGDIVALASAQPDAPPVAASDPDLVVTEVQIPEGTIETAAPEGERRAVEVLKAYRIEGSMLASKDARS